MTNKLRPEVEEMLSELALQIMNEREYSLYMAYKRKGLDGDAQRVRNQARKNRIQERIQTLKDVERE